MAAKIILRLFFKVENATVVFHSRKNTETEIDTKVAGQPRVQTEFFKFYANSKMVAEMAAKMAA